MFSLPRGIASSLDVPLTSAAWERADAVERLVYRDDGAIFLGAMPYRDMWPHLQAMRERGADLLAAIDASDRPPLQRAELVDALEHIWLQAQRSEVVPLGFRDDRHVVTIAGARSGKGRSAIVPNLCIYPGSVVTIDPKGENASLTAARRGAGSAWCDGMGQDVYVLDPFGVADVPDALRAGMNPFDLLDLTADTLIDDAALLAEALVVPTGKDSAHWDESARNYVKGLALYLVARGGNPSLFTLRRLLTQGDREGYLAACANDPDFQEGCPSALWFLLDNMRAIQTGNPDLDDAIIGTAETLAQCGENERGSILSTARRNTAFLDTLGARFRSTLEGTGRRFHPDSLKNDPRGVSVYLCLPAARMGAHSRWLRVMLNLILERMQRSLTPPVSGVPVLFVLDEFYTLGPMSTIENAAGFAAGFGVKLWPILQDLQQLKTLYPTSWQTFLANAGAVQVFGASDAETCEYVSRMLGQVETRQTVRSLNTSEQTGFGQKSEVDRIAPMVGALGAKRLGAAALHAAVVASMDDQSVSGGASQTINVSEQITLAPLLRPDEVAQQFARETGAALVMIKGRRPIWTLRVDYDSSPWFVRRYTPLAAHQAHAIRGEAQSFGQRDTRGFTQCVMDFNSLVQSAGMD